jgi:anti-sigma regulatory factor (Ser/Thr protein kinase)
VRSPRSAAALEQAAAHTSAVPAPRPQPRASGETTPELVSNAVTASQALEPVCPVRLWLLADATRVLILVWDASPKPPVRIDPDGEAESGRGLLLVEAISDRWDWYPAPPQTGGKVVWALATR